MLMWPSSIAPELAGWDEDILAIELQNLLEADIDDMTPASLAHACDRLRAEGARELRVGQLELGLRGGLGTAGTLMGVEAMSSAASDAGREVCS